MGVSVQQELVPRVGLTVGYFRRWFGNFYTANTASRRRPTIPRSASRYRWILGCQAAVAAL